MNKMKLAAHTSHNVLSLSYKLIDLMEQWLFITIVGYLLNSIKQRIKMHIIHTCDAQKWNKVDVLMTYILGLLNGKPLFEDLVHVCA